MSRGTGRTLQSSFPSVLRRIRRRYYPGYLPPRVRRHDVSPHTNPLTGTINYGLTGTNPCIGTHGEHPPRGQTVTGVTQSWKGGSSDWDGTVDSDPLPHPRLGSRRSFRDRNLVFAQDPESRGVSHGPKDTHTFPIPTWDTFSQVPRDSWTEHDLRVSHHTKSSSAFTDESHTSPLTIDRGDADRRVCDIASRPLRRSRPRGATGTVGAVGVGDGARRGR